MLGFICGFIIGLLVMKYMENQAFKAKVNSWFGGLFTSSKKKKK